MHESEQICLICKNGIFSPSLCNSFKCARRVISSRCSLTCPRRIRTGGSGLSVSSTGATQSSSDEDHRSVSSSQGQPRSPRHPTLSLCLSQAEILHYSLLQGPCLLSSGWTGPSLAAPSTTAEAGGPLNGSPALGRGETWDFRGQGCS